MEANKHGVAFTKAELRLLREFGSKEPTDRDRYGVQIEVKGDRVYARATNSRICCELDGTSDGKLHDGEWFVGMKFLIDGRKELEGKQVLRLCFKGGSLHEAVVEENGLTRLTLTSETDAAIAQISFPPFVKTLKKPSARREKLHCHVMSATYARAATLAADAAEEELITWYPPATADGLVVFEAGGEKNTSILGGILANVTAESVAGDGEEEDDEDEKPKGRRGKKNGRQLSIVDSETAS